MSSQGKNNKRFNLSSSSSSLTIEQYMNQSENQKYANITFFEKELGGLSHKELVLSKFGAVLKGGLTGRKEFFDGNISFYLDEQNRIVNLGNPGTYNQLIFNYNQIFYS